MAKVRLILDTRSRSKSRKSGLYPVVLKIIHHKVGLIYMGARTSKSGWDDKNHQLRKSAYDNRNLNCDYENRRLDEKFYQAKSVVDELGDSVEHLDVKRLREYVEKAWDENPNSDLKKKVENEISLEMWGQRLIKRKLAANLPNTAKWLRGGINAITAFNAQKDIMLYDITVSFLKDFEAHHLSKGNSKNTISIYLRAVRSIYNSAISEDRFIPLKNVFQHYKVPRTKRTRKRALLKEELRKIKALEYPEGTVMWHAWNYLFIMFYCRGMNFIDLVKIKAKDFKDGRLSYGRSKTGEPFSIAITEDLQKIMQYYIVRKKPNGYLFPNYNDGSTEQFQKYKSQRRRMNERLKLMAEEAGVTTELTTYAIRHSWATIAKYTGISTALISEGLGHSSVKTTEVYLKDFENAALDEITEKVASMI